MAYKIQRLNLGGVLDQAIAITKDHFGLLFSIMLFLLVPFNLIMQFMLMSMQPELPPNPTFDDYQCGAQEAVQGNLPFIFLFLFLNGLVVLPLTNGAVIQAVARLYLGQPVTAGEAYRQALRRLLPLIGTSILMGLIIMLGFILLIIPGIIFMVWYGLSQHVVIIEEMGGMAALKRSKELVQPQWGTFLALMFVTGLITAGVGWGAALIPQPHVQMGVSVLLNAVTTVLWTAAFVVFYFSCRCVVDNFDLHYLAEQIGAPPPAKDAAPAPDRGAF